MATDNWDENENSIRLADLTRDGDLTLIVGPIELERDSYREVAVQKTIELNALTSAKDDVEAEAVRRIRRPHLKSVKGA